MKKLGLLLFWYTASVLAMAPGYTPPGGGGGGPPSGGAGGDLGGTYPNPTVVSLTNALPMSDAAAQICNSLDSTKKVKLSASIITTGTTRTITVPDVTGTLVVSPNTGVTIAGPTAARTITIADASDTLAELGQLNTFSVDQTFAANIIASNGSAATPSITFASQPTTGFAINSGSYITAGNGYAGVLFGGNNSGTGTIGVSGDGIIYFCVKTRDATGGAGCYFSQVVDGVVTITGSGATGGGAIACAKNSATAISGNTDDYACGEGTFQRWTATGAFNVTGMVASTDGAIRYIWNIGANTITLKNADAGSAAANRWTCSTGADLALATKKCALAIYDLTSTTWRVTLLP